MLLREVKNIFHKELDLLYGKEEVASFFYLLIEHYFDLERFVLALQPDLVIDKEQETVVFNALSKLKLELPIQHILGTTHFMELDFKVNEHVLIPRPETEELVRWVLDDVKQLKPSLNILDMGTGSGCIPISLAKHLPDAQIIALDISPKALEIAEENATTHQVKVNFHQADILNLNLTSNSDRSGNTSLLNELNYDVIISNPPYVRDLEKAEMSKNVLAHEPSIALFVPDDDPLKFYRSIVNFAAQHLKPKGNLYLEINQYLGAEMQELLQEFNFKTIQLRKDLYGNDRMIKGTKK